MTQTHSVVYQADSAADRNGRHGGRRGGPEGHVPAWTLTRADVTESGDR